MAHAAQHIHDHSELTGTQLAKAARATMEARGEQWTEMRGDIFAVLAAAEKPVSAYDIADKVSSRRGKRVAPNSVYRILDLFVRTNLANRIESSNAYLANTHPGCRHDCIYLICDSCGRAVHLDDDQLTGALRLAGQKVGFVDVRPVVELRGICDSCGPLPASAGL